MFEPPHFQRYDARKTPAPYVLTTIEQKHEGMGEVSRVSSRQEGYRSLMKRAACYVHALPQGSFVWEINSVLTA